jgi:hypothetical protein
MVQALNKIRNGLLELNVVFPKRVITINEQGLGNKKRRHRL